MAHDADDKRPLFQRIIDDITEQISTGALRGGAVLPTARTLADDYGVAAMTVQRALRELQHQGLIYAVVGKGTFVHPEANARLNGAALAARRSVLQAAQPMQGNHVAQSGGSVPSVMVGGLGTSNTRSLSTEGLLFLLHQHDICARIVHAVLAEDAAAIHRAVDELTTWATAHRDLADDLANGHRPDHGDVA